MASLLAQFAAGALAGIGKQKRGKGGGVLAFAGNALGVGGTDTGTGKRRRRRKALTDSDMAQAAQISSMISKKAGENFILRRTRSG